MFIVPIIESQEITQGQANDPICHQSDNSRNSHISHATQRAQSHDLYPIGKLENAGKNQQTCRHLYYRTIVDVKHRQIVSENDEADSKKKHKERGHRKAGKAYFPQILYIPPPQLVSY